MELLFEIIREERTSRESRVVLVVGFQYSFFSTEVEYADIIDFIILAIPLDGIEDNFSREGIDGYRIVCHPRIFYHIFNIYHQFRFSRAEHVAIDFCPGAVHV